MASGRKTFLFAALFALIFFAAVLGKWRGAGGIVERPRHPQIAAEGARPGGELGPVFPDVPWDGEHGVNDGSVARHAVPSDQEIESSDLLLLATDGRPVPNLRMGRLEPLPRSPYDLEGPPNSQYLGTTDRSGRLVVQRSAGEFVSIVSMDPLWLVVGSSVLTGPAGGEFVIWVRGGGRVSGQVVGESGPIQGATVGALVSTKWLDFGQADGPPDLTPDFFDPANMRWVTTDEWGYFELGGLLSSSHRIDILAEGYAPRQHRYAGPNPSELVDVGAIELRRGFDVTLRFASGVALESDSRLYFERKDDGFTRGRDGLPVDYAGVVAVPDLAAGKYSWVLERPGIVSVVGEVEVSEGETDFTIQLDSLREVQVNVTGTDGSPVLGFKLKIKTMGGRDQVFEGDGTVVVLASSGATFDIRAEASGFVAPPKTRVQPDTAVVDIMLSLPGQLEVAASSQSDLEGLHLGVIFGEEADQVELVENGIYPAPIPYREFDKRGRILIQDLSPGEIWLVAKIGQALRLYGPYTVVEGQVSRVTLSLPVIQVREGTVLDKSTGRGLPGVSIYARGRASSSVALAGLLGVLSATGPPESISAVDGSFSIALGAEDSCYIEFVLDGYASRSVLIGTQQGSGPLVVELEALPVLSISVHLTESTPASRATIEILRHTDRIPEFLGKVTTGADGTASTSLVPAGMASAEVKYMLAPDVSYRVGFHEVAFASGTPIRLVLAPRHGYLTVQGASSLPGTTLTIRREASPELGWAEIRLGPLSDPRSRESIPVTPGVYQIALSSPSETSYAQTEVYAQATSVVSLDVGPCSVEASITGVDLTSCLLKLRSAAGASNRISRFLEAVGPGGTATFDQLPVGSYRVTLVSWTPRLMTPKLVGWTKSIDVTGSNAQVHFDLEDLSELTVQAIDSRGFGVPRVSLEFVARSSLGTSVSRARTGQDGKCSISLPPGEIAVVARPRGLAPSVVVVGEERGGVPRIPCLESSSLEVLLPLDALPTWQVRLLPAPAQASSLGAALLLNLLDSLTLELGNLVPGGSVSIDGLPPGKYVLTVLGREGLVASTELVLASGKASRFIVPLQ